MTTLGQLSGPETTAALREIAGLRLSPHYGAGKIRWLLNNNADVVAAYRQGNLVIASDDRIKCFALFDGCIQRSAFRWRGRIRLG